MHKLVAEHVYAEPVKGKFGNQAVHYTRCGGEQLALTAVWVTLKHPFCLVADAEIHTAKADANWCIDGSDALSW